MSQKTISLNEISRADKFHAVAISRSDDVRYRFSANATRNKELPVKFHCHIRDAVGARTVYLMVDTLSASSNENCQDHFEGDTLEELVHNLDWPHRPSELAQLKMVLAACSLTDSGLMIGEYVNFRLDNVQLAKLAERRIHQSNESRRRQVEELTSKVTQAIAKADDSAALAASFGLRTKVEPCLVTMSV